MEVLELSEMLLLKNLHLCNYGCGKYIGFLDDVKSLDGFKLKPIEATSGDVHECPSRGWSEYVNCLRCNERVCFHNGHRNPVTGNKIIFSSPGIRHHCVAIEFRNLNSTENAIVEHFRKKFESRTNHAQFLSEFDAKLISASQRGNQLYEIEDVIPGRNLKLLRYNDPSTQEEYMCFVPEYIRDSDEAMAWKFYLTEEEYGDIITEA